MISKTHFFIALGMHVVVVVDFVFPVKSIGAMTRNWVNEVYQSTKGAKNPKEKEKFWKKIALYLHPASFPKGGAFTDLQFLYNTYFGGIFNLNL